MKIRSRKPKEEKAPEQKPAQDPTWPFPIRQGPYIPPPGGYEEDDVLERTTKGVTPDWTHLGWHVDFNDQCVYWNGWFVATIQDFKNDFTDEMIQSYHEA